MFLQPLFLASYYASGPDQQEIKIWYDKRLTRKATSTLSLGMFVHVRCMQVSSPMRLWHVLIISAVKSDDFPPAFLSGS